MQLTRDGLEKMSPVFSPDGSRVAYTVVDRNFSWDTWVVPVLGGEPQRMMPNASGLTWIREGSGGQRLLFSEIKKGIHMAIVAAAESRAQSRDVYLPPSEMGMAHRSYLSPDGKRVLLAEMDNVGWLPCRLVPFDGSAKGKPVGPPGQCTSAAWSPDGQWVYFNSDAGGGFHIWRQRLAGDPPQQITFGPTEESGIAMAADGRSFVTSVGGSQSAVWLRDASGERQISAEGYGYLPAFSADGKKLYYLVRRGTSRAFVSGELWVADLNSGRNERLLPDFMVTSYSISTDGKRAAFAVLDSDGKSRLWLAWLDRRFPPRQMPSLDEDSPAFGPSGEVFFRATEGGQNFIYRMKENGTERRKVVPDPVIHLISVSPDGQWVLARVAVSGEEAASAIVAYPIAGGSSTRVCDFCEVKWSPDGKVLYLFMPGMGAAGAGKTLVIPLRAGKALPPLPSSGFKSEADLAVLGGLQTIPQGSIYPGPNSSVYAFCRTIVQRNLYRIPIP